jgi:hypothetical protein
MTLGEAAFDKIISLYRSSKVPSVQRACLLALAVAPTEALIQRLLEASVNSSLIRTQDTGIIMRALASSGHLGARLAWSFLQSRFDDVFAAEQFGVVRTLQSITAYLHTDSDLAELEALLDNQAANKVGDASRKSLLEALRHNAYWVSTTRSAFVNALVE